MQVVWAGSGQWARQVELPDCEEEIVAGVPWGTPELAGTPAYWAVRCRWDPDTIPDFGSSRGCLVEEIGFCLLGGYGVTFEVNVAAFERLKALDVFDLESEVDEAAILAMLLRPLDVCGRPRRYRFPNQRARRIASLRRRLLAEPPEALDVVALRRYLSSLEGVGPKTASWIVRNHLGSDDVAIIDVHVVRACRRMGLFPDAISLPRDYDALESRFLDFARALGVRSSLLDAVMWVETRGGVRRDAVAPG